MTRTGSSPGSCTSSASPTRASAASRGRHYGSLFQKLCGAESFKNVVVLTTFWDQVSPAVGGEREEELRSNFFKTIVDGGGRFMRHDRNNAASSSHAVLSYIISEMAPVVTQIQTEMGAEHKSLADTAAHAELERVAAAHAQQHAEEVARLAAEVAAENERNASEQRALEEHRAQVLAQEAQREAERLAMQQALQAEQARQEAERVALQARLAQEAMARRQLEERLAAERAHQEWLRWEEVRRLEEQARANAEQARINAQIEEQARRNAEWERQREEEHRRREEEQRRRDADSDSGDGCVVC